MTPERQKEILDRVVEQVPTPVILTMMARGLVGTYMESGFKPSVKEQLNKFKNALDTTDQEDEELEAAAEKVLGDGCHGD